MLMKMRNTKGFTLVELMIVVAIIGILAAIAIPAFLRSVKKSKTSEAEGNMRKIADGAKSYFTSEQKYSNTTTGDQPWHDAAAASVAQGLPVPWAAYVFPGAANGFRTTEGTGILAGSVMAPNCGAGSPTGGSKLLPTAPFLDKSSAALTAILNKLGVSFNDPVYFEYTYSPTGLGATANAWVRACANFDTDAPQHTITQQIEINDQTQEVEVRPAFTENEFR